MARKRETRRGRLPVGEIFARHPVLKDFNESFMLVGFAAKRDAIASVGRRKVTVRVVWTRRRGSLTETIAVSSSGDRG